MKHNIRVKQQKDTTMFLLTIFESKKTREEKSHLKNLVQLAMADGNLSQSERKAIYKIGAIRGLKDDEIAELFENDQTDDKTEMSRPSTDTERFDQLFDLVTVMLADGKVTDSEMDFCINVAKSLGFSKAFSGVIVNKIAMGLSNNLSKKAIKTDMSSFLSF